MTTRAFAVMMAAALTAPTFAAQCMVDALTAEFTDAPGARLDLADEVPMRLAFEVVDGKTGEALDARSGDLRDGLTVAQQPRVSDTVIHWTLSFENAGDEQRWLEVRAVIRPEGGGPLGFWNGHADYSPAPAQVPPFPARECTPLVALTGENAGLAWGLEPHALMSWYEGAGDRDDDGRRFWFGCRIVIDPDQTLELPLVLFSYPATFGYLDAFERYHDLFPMSFGIGANAVDPRATGAGCDYVGWHKGSPELVRRVGGSWDWCMRSWRLPGNWANREELWREDFGDYDRWRERWTEKAEHMARCDFAGMYYIWPAWTDEDLAAERWPDALVNDPLAPRTTWEHTTMAHLTFPANNAYAEHTREHLREILAGGKYHGFGLDSAGSDGRARGPGAQASPGRAWDDGGVYCRVNVGMAQLMDAIHQMEAQDGYRAACVPNGGDWMIFARADSILIEHSPIDRENEWVARLNAGEKVLNWWDQFDIHYFVDWESGEREELRHAIAGMARLMRLRSLQLGGVPMYRQASGIVSTMEDLPEIAEIVRAGWQPVPAMKGDDRLWLSRYGDGQGPGSANEPRYLVVANPETEQINGPIVVFTEYLGSGGHLLVDAHGYAVTQHVDGRRTTIDARIPPAWERVYTPVAWISDDARLHATVGLAGELHERVLQVTVHSAETPCDIRPIAPEGYQAPPIGYWHHAARPDGPGEETSWPFRIEEPGMLEVRMPSEWFGSPAREILDFPFVEEAQPACTIVIPEDATSDEEYAAFRIQEYFRFWYSEPNRDGEPTLEYIPIIPIVPGEAEGPRVILKRSQPGGGPQQVPPPWQAAIRLEGDDLVVEYLRADLAKQAVYELLRLLDRKYRFHGATPEKFEHERELAVYERAGLVNQVLDDREELGM